ALVVGLRIPALIGIDPDLDALVELEVLVCDESLRVRLRRSLQRDQPLVHGLDLPAIARLQVLEHSGELRAQLGDLAVEHQAARGVEAVEVALDRALLDLRSERALD